MVTRRNRKVSWARKSGGFIGKCWVCSPAGHNFMRCRYPPQTFQRPVCDVQKLAGALLQLPMSLVQSDVLQGQNDTGKGALTYSIHFGYDGHIVLHTTELPGLLNPWLFLLLPACHTTFPLFCFLSKKKGSTEGCEI